MQTLQTETAEKMIQGLLSKNNPGLGLNNDLRFTQAYTGNLETPAVLYGGFGFLPVSGFGNGDVAALRAVPGKPVQEWPVLRMQHDGAGGSTFASSISSLIPGFLVSFSIHGNRTEVFDEAQKYEDLSEYLGGTKAAVKRVIDALRSRSVGTKTGRAELYTLAESPGDLLLDFYEAWNAAYVKGVSAAKIWTQFKQKHALFACADHLLFQAALVGGSEDSVHAAWNVVCGPLMFDNFETFPACKASNAPGIAETSRSLLCADDPVPVAARFLIENSGAKEYGRDPRWSAVEAIASGEMSASLWLKAARALLKADHPQEAYTAALNAAHAHNADTEEPMPEARKVAAQCAAHMQDELLLSLLEVAQVKSSRKKATKKTGIPELLKAAANGDASAVLAAIEDGADPSVRDSHGSQAVHLAAKDGHVEVLGCLLDAGVDVNAPNSISMTPFLVAAENGKTEAVKFLVQRGAAIHGTTYMGDSAITAAILMEAPETALVLIDLGVDVNAANDAGVTALHRAAARGYADVVRALLSHGASATLKTTDGETALDWAESEKQPETAALLRNHLAQ